MAWSVAVQIKCIDEFRAGRTDMHPAAAGHSFFNASNAENWVDLHIGTNDLWDRMDSVSGGTTMNIL